MSRTSKKALGTWRIDRELVEMLTGHAAYGRRRKFKKNTVLYEQGEISSCFYFVLKGLVQISIYRVDGAEVVLTKDPDALRRVDRIVVPGQGSFGAFASSMRGGLLEALRERIREGTPYLGASVKMYPGPSGQQGQLGQCRTEQRRGNQATAQLLENCCGVSQFTTGATEFLGDHQGGDTDLLTQLRPQRLVVAPIGFHRLAHRSR